MLDPFWGVTAHWYRDSSCDENNQQDCGFHGTSGGGSILTGTGLARPKWEYRH